MQPSVFLPCKNKANATGNSRLSTFFLGSSFALRRLAPKSQRLDNCRSEGGQALVPQHLAKLNLPHTSTQRSLSRACWVQHLSHYFQIVLQKTHLGVLQLLTKGKDIICRADVPQWAMGHTLSPFPRATTIKLFTSRGEAVRR